MLDNKKTNINDVSLCEQLIAMLCAVTFALIVCLTAITLCVAQIVFSVQAEIIGTRMYKNSIQNTCTHDIGIWFIVFGSLTFCSMFFVICSKCIAKNISGLSGLCSLVQIGWCSYGAYMCFREEQYRDTTCYQKDWDLFVIVTNFILWGSVFLSVVGFIGYVCQVYNFILNSN